jgi:U3 small nucleolar RNA-associated protein 22
MFIHPTDDYDFIIQLDRKILPRYAQNICFDESTFTRKGASTYINLMETEKSTITAGLDPAELFRGDLMVSMFSPCGVNLLEFILSARIWGYL